MLRLCQPALAALLEETYELERILTTEMGNQEQTAYGLQFSWFGAAADAFQGAMLQEMQNGSYASAYSYVKGLREMLEFYMPIINHLMATCELLEEHLKQNTYSELISSLHEEKYLTVEYDYLSSFNADCVMAMDSAKKAKHVLQEMIDGAWRWVNSAAEDEEIEYAWRKIERLENYREAFACFVHKVSMLESDMTYEMDKIISQNDSFLMPDACLAPKAEAKREHDMTTFEELKKVENASSSYDLEKVREILNKEAENWSVQDCEYLAGAFEAYLQEKDIYGLTVLISGLMKVDYVTYRAPIVSRRYDMTYCVVSADTQKLQKITEQLDKVRQATAYKTLCNLSEVEELKVACDDETTRGMVVNPAGLNEEVPYLTLLLFASAMEGGHSGRVESAKVYVQGLEDMLPAKTKESINQLGYTYEEVADMLEQYDLKLSYKEYEKLSLEDMELYDGRAKDYAFAMIAENTELPYEYSVPIGYDMTLTYSATTKGTVPGELVNTTLEHQRTELKSIALSEGNTEAALGNGSLGVTQKVDIGESGTQVGGGVDFSMGNVGVSVSMVNGNTEKGLKYEQNINGTITTIYFVETKISEIASIYSEVKIAKDGNDSMRSWEPISSPLIDVLPEPIREVIENPIFSLPSMPQIPIKGI